MTQAPRGATHQPQAPGPGADARCGGDFDSTQIFEYFEHIEPHPPLWPADPAARAQARLLELKSDEVFFPHVIRLMVSRIDSRSRPRRRLSASCTATTAR